jgi:hypothetical protein
VFDDGTVVEKHKIDLAEYEVDVRTVKMAE